jgi:hypothetical protein
MYLERDLRGDVAWFVVAAPEASGGDTELASERAGECEFRGVADLPRDGGKWGIGLSQQLGALEQPPADQVCHRRLSHRLREPPGERGTRYAGHLAEPLHRPRCLRAVVDLPQSGGDRRVADLYWSKTLLLLLTWCFMLAADTR